MNFCSARRGKEGRPTYSRYERASLVNEISQQSTVDSSELGILVRMLVRVRSHRKRGSRRDHRIDRSRYREALLNRTPPWYKREHGAENEVADIVEELAAAAHPFPTRRNPSHHERNRRRWRAHGGHARAIAAGVSSGISTAGISTSATTQLSLTHTSWVCNKRRASAAPQPPRDDPDRNKNTSLPSERRFAIENMV